MHGLAPTSPTRTTATTAPDVTWWAAAGWKGARLTEDGYPDPAAACLALATTVLTGASCRCGKKVALGPRLPGCRWRLKGDRWEPSCTADPLHVPGPRGDVTAMQKAMDDRKRHTNG